ncbi:MAG: hypothetical protein JNM84_15120 [Planctomycetes bacterium]|nr:hypothetical protein [Planctomycetota bacterium]
MTSNFFQGALRRFAFVAGAAALTLTSTHAQNDECVGALAIVDGLNGPYNNSTATYNPADLAFSCGGTASLAKDLWFSYLATVSGSATFETCNPGFATFDTRLALYSGSCGALTLIGCSDDACSTQSRVSGTLISGTTYYVRVAGYNGGSGAFAVRAISADSCEGAVTLVNGPNGPFSSVGATNSTPAFPCASGGADIWFRWVATCTGTATADLCASSYDSIVEAFSGTCGALTSIGCNDDDPSCGLRSKLSFPVTTGSTYLLRVGGFLGATGNVNITMSCSGAPANDECAGAIGLLLGANAGYSNVLSTTSATTPACSLSANDVWFRFTAPSSADYRFETCGSSFDTVIGLYSGSCASLTSIACNDDACGFGSSLTASLVRNTTYYLAVAGFNGATGNITVTVTGGIGYANDECAGALPLAVGVNAPYTTIGATTSTAPGAFSCGGGANDAWHSFTAPCDGDWVFETCGSGFDTVVQLYSGTCGALTSIQCNDDFCGLQSRVSAPGLTTGQTVYLRVGGFNGAQGAYLVRATLTGNIGSFSNIVTGCGGLTLTATGAPTLAGSVTYALGGFSGATSIWFGGAIGPFQVCPPETCALGADFGIVLGGVNTVTIVVPCDISIVGGSLACQGADLLAVAGNCPAGEPFTVNFSDTVVTTIN